MADKVGSVYIEASVDTAGVIQAGKAISGVADKIESDLKSVGNAADTMSDKLNESGKSVSRFGIELSTADQKLGRFIDLQGRVREATGRFTTGMLANGESVKSFNKSIADVGGVVDDAGNKLGGFGGKVTALGVQLQDIAVQAQAGTSAFIILGQQGSQLASSFGPGGAVVGAVIAVAAAIGGVLFSSVSKTSKEIEEQFIPSIEDMREKLDQLSKSQASFAIIQIQKEMEQLTGLSRIAGARVEYLTKQLEKYPSNKDAKEWSEELVKQQALFDGVSQKTAKLKKDQEAFQDVIKRSIDGTQGQQEADKKRIETIEDLLIVTEKQAAIAGLTQRGIALYVAEQANASVADKKRINDAFDIIEAEQRKADAIKAAKSESIKARKDDLTLQRESRAELDRELQAELAAIDAKNKAQSNVSGIISGGDGSPAARAAAEAEAKIATIQQYQNMELISAEQAADAIIAIEQQKQAELNRLNNEAVKQRVDFQQSQNMMMLSMAQGVFGELAQTVENAKGKESGAYKAAFMAAKASAIAIAIIQTELAATAALAPPPFGLGPVAGLPYSNVIRGIGYASAGLMAAQVVAGSGKLYGGPVQAGGMYPVTEDGRPEILKQGNRQYLLPGSRGGEVVSNRDMQQAGGSSIVINYNPTIYAQEADFEAIMAGQPEAVLNAVRIGLASEGRTL